MNEVHGQFNKKKHYVRNADELREFQKLHLDHVLLKEISFMDPIKNHFEKIFVRVAQVGEEKPGVA